VEWICRNSAGLTVPSYFSDRWGQNLGGQTTIHRCGANTMHPQNSRGARGERCMCSLVRTHWCMQVEVSLEVATLDVSTPLTVALDGGATVLPTSTAVDLLPGSPGGACATDGVHVADGRHDCCVDGWRRPSRCGMLMAAMTSWSTL
jgi:hypothetical protein